MHIDIDYFALDQFIPQKADDFPSRSAFLHYKAQCIAAQRDHLLSHWLQRPVTTQDIARSPRGKPYWREDASIAFNHSHSQGHYALAKSNTVLDLGIDLEDLKREVRFEALAQHAFHAAEYQHWQDLNCDPHYWFKVWTCKEAVLKASGLGIGLSLKTLNTQVMPTAAKGQCLHDAIGHFCYQHLQCAASMLCVAWRLPASASATWPEITLRQHLG
ncbi:4'-phosphopantetheinyl transferase family protein [Acinetobacter larvae]|uniref:4'-phosphopantetheinyl transferase domain-containing protein n=1 Tax=Acinetobacter larvae TaxID=1789224 RepID=A0A1B2M256_9GAMM|nr:4'-phosphopantetheinyl transferase superfamily protein [Acinetobacter larvae]AOA59280.1 hypothetical protein BFG52_13565 [Acinetobacter larvae]